MRRLPICLVALVSLVALSGCSSGGTSLPNQAEKSSAIVNGQADTTHQAVAALLVQYPGSNQGSSCSGTFIGVSGATGYFLTAAHCVLSPGMGLPAPTAANMIVVQGDDYQAQASDIQYTVTDFQYHPMYTAGDASSPYDFAIVKFTGAGSGTPVIQALADTEDQLAVGQTLDFIGYGQTDNAGQSMNSVRNAIVMPIGQLDPLTFSYDQSNGGVCHGDSGGPAIVVVGGQERVAGVTSNGTQTNTGMCNGVGTSGRVSAVYASWIVPYMMGTMGTGMQTCQQCEQGSTSGMGKCTSQVKACQNDADCTALLQCLNSCAAGDATCQQGCATMHPAGTMVYGGINSCICQTGCVAECAMQCKGTTPAMCGLGFPDPGGACFNQNCCSQGTACAADAACTACFHMGAPMSCSTNTLATAVYQCVQTSCASQFMLPPPAKCGVSDMNATCQSCFETSCCAEAQACVKDSGCSACLGMPTAGASCSTNAPFTGFLGCIQKSCSTQCSGGMMGAGGGSGAGGGTGAAGSVMGTAGSGTGTAGSGTGTAGNASAGGSPGAAGGSPAAAGGGTSKGGAGGSAGPGGPGPVGGGGALGAAGNGMNGAGNGMNGAGNAMNAAGNGPGDVIGGPGGNGQTDNTGTQSAPSSSSSGCSVPAPGSRSPAAAGLLLALLALPLVRRRRARGLARVPGPHGPLARRPPRPGAAGRLPFVARVTAAPPRSSGRPRDRAVTRAGGVSRGHAQAEHRLHSPPGMGGLREQRPPRCARGLRARNVAAAAALLASGAAGAEEPARMSWDRPSPCKRDGHGEIWRVQCDPKTRACLFAPDAELDAKGTRLRPLDRMPPCGGSEPFDQAALQGQGYRLTQAILPAPYGWSRDGLGRVFQTNFDLHDRLYVGGAWSPELRDGRFGASRSLLEFGLLEYQSFTNERNPLRHRLKLVEGQVRLAPTTAEGFLLRYDISSRRRDPLVRVTSFLGEPRRGDLTLDLGLFFEAGGLEVHSVPTGTATLWRYATLDPTLDLWHSADMYSFVRVRGGAAIEKLSSTTAAVAERSAITPGAAVDADFTLDRDGFHHLTGVGQAESPRLFADQINLRTGATRLKAELSYEVIVLALNDQPISLRFSTAATRRDDIPTETTRWVYTTTAGLRFSLWAPAREP